MAVTCAHCDEPLTSAKSTYCSQRCRTAACRERKRPEVAVLVPVEGGESTVSAVRGELEAAGRVGTFRGQAALRLAERIDASTAVMGFAQLVKQLESTMDAALEGVQVAKDPLDELRAARDRKYAAG